MLLYIGWKLSIVRGSFSLSFIKGIRCNLHLKIFAFSKHFPLNMLFILKKLSSTLSGLLSGNEWQNTSSLCNAARYTNLFKLKCIYLKQRPTLQRKMCTATWKKLTNFSLWRDYVRLNTTRLWTELTNFKGYGTPLSLKPTFFKGTCPLEWKCSLNTELFKRKLRRIPLIKLCENGPWTMLEGRAFEWCIAT